MKICLVVLLILGGFSTAFSAVVADGDYVVDTDHAHVGFSVSHLGISNVQGRFNKFSGNAKFVSGGESVVNFVIDAASVDTNQPRRNKHIMSGDFFDVESFPEIRFSSTKVIYSAEGDVKSIQGDLSLHGEIKSVTFEVSVVGVGAFPEGVQRAGYVAKAKVNRSDFGITSFPAVVGEEISITVNLETIKQ